MTAPRRNHHARGVHTIAPMGPRTLGQHKAYYTATLEHEPCPVLGCGQIMGEHVKCTACNVLIGRGHNDDRCYDGLCAACVVQRDSGPVGEAMVMGAQGI